MQIGQTARILNENKFRNACLFREVIMEKDTTISMTRGIGDYKSAICILKSMFPFLGRQSIIIREIDQENGRLFTLGISPEYTITTVSWNDWMFEEYYKERV